MNIKFYGFVSLACLIFSIVWIVLLIYSIIQSGPTETLEQAYKLAGNAGFNFYLTYINAVFITITATILFTGIYFYCKSTDPQLALIGLIFIPVYCVFCLFSYFSQISILPRLLSHINIINKDSNTTVLVGQVLQGWQESAVWIINNLAYAVLGIPSIVFGISLYKRGGIARTTSIFLILSGLASIFGIVGIVSNNKLIGMSSAIGGVLFIISLVYLSLMFFRNPKII